MAKEDKGQPNPRYVSLAAEIAEAEAEVAKWDTFHAWMKKELAATPPRRRIKTNTGEWLEPEQCFLKPDNTYLTLQQAWKKYVAACFPDQA
jgi:hypothetical protein